MRKNRTPAEKRLHTLLQKWKIRFRSQRPFDFYIVDFLIPDRRVVIEVDGASHQGKEAYDAKRERYLMNKGLNILRVTNKTVLTTNCEPLRKQILAYPVQPIDPDWRKSYGRAAY